MAELTKLESKLGEVTGLAMAAQAATKKVVALAKDEHREVVSRLEQMQAEAAETVRRCTELAGTFEGKRTAILREATAGPVALLADEDLVARCARGDPSALAAMYDRHGAIAYGLALRVIRDPALAEDAVQEAFLALWRSAAGFDCTRTRVRSWILMLVHRKAVDLVRREQRRRAEPLPDGAEGWGDGADEEVEQRSNRALVRRALAQLPDDQREVLELAYYGGYTQSELAAKLGVPLGTVKSRTFAAFARLRELLREADLAPADDAAPAAAPGRAW